MRALFALSILAFGLAGPVLAQDDGSRAKVLAALAELERLAREQVETGGVPGLSIAVVHRDEVVYAKGFGVREVGKSEAVDADTVFQLASCSKPIASTVVAALVGDGKLAWDSRIAEIDPSFQLHDPYPSADVTVADLFAHRSGLPGAAGNELEQIGYDRAEILRRLRLVPPSSSFRAGYSYSNFGLTAGAVAAAHAAGSTWDDVAEERLFKPLRMGATSARYADFIARTDRAALHVRVDGHWAAAARRNADAQSPAGGVSSSARDMAQWLRLQLSGGMLGPDRIVQAAALARTHEPVFARGDNPVSGAPSFYGLGWAVDYGAGGVVWSHAGAFSQGARTMVALSPGDRLGIVILSNAFPTGVPDALAGLFLDLAHGEHPPAAERIAQWNLLYEGLFAPAVAAAQATFGTPRPDAAAALPASAYLGAYANAYIGTARIVEADGVLRLRLGPGRGVDVPLRHHERDVFSVAMSPEIPEARSAVSFRIGADGRAEAVTIEAVDDVGLGTLRRTD